MSVPRLSSGTLLRVLLALCVAAYSLLIGNLGCSSGAVCYRQTDCPSGASCQSGQCVRPVAVGDGGVAGTTSSDGTAGSDGSATARADSGATAGSNGTAGGP